MGLVYKLWKAKYHILVTNCNSLSSTITIQNVGSLNRLTWKTIKCAQKMIKFVHFKYVIVICLHSRRTQWIWFKQLSIHCVCVWTYREKCHRCVCYIDLYDVHRNSQYQTSADRYTCYEFQIFKMITSIKIFCCELALFHAIITKFRSIEEIAKQSCEWQT